MLSLPSYTNKFDKANPLTNAVGWISGVHLDLSALSGRIVFNINPNVTAAGNNEKPIDQVSIGLGELITKGNPPTQDIKFETLSEFMADKDFAAAFLVIKNKLEQAALALPVFSKATIV